MDDPRQRLLQMSWVNVTDIIKKNIVNPTVWRAMEAVKPLALEGNILVLGISGPDYHLASSLESVAVRKAIEEQLPAARGQPVHYQIIQGESIQDWIDTKERERIAREMSAKPQKIVLPTREAAPLEVHSTDTWEDITTYIHRAFNSLSVKSLLQVRARFVMDMLPFLYEAETRLNTGREPTTEERGFARALEKVAQMAETDPVVVALEYLRYKQARPQKETSE